ncbi:MAG: toprim domain-containing protein [Candidatus Dormibacteraceae bacterium]
MLEDLGLRDASWYGMPAVEMPYLSQAGRQLVVRYRIALKGDRFRWRKGDAPSLYGLHRLQVARALGFVVLVEGESDCHAAWLHNVPAVGIPGSSMWKPFWAELLAGINDIYLVVEPDQGGQVLIAKLGDSFVGRLRLVQDLGVKDLGELHLEDPLGFVRRFEIAQAKAVPHRSAEQNRWFPAPAEPSSARRKAWRDRRGHVHVPAIEVPL